MIGSSFVSVSAFLTRFSGSLTNLAKYPASTVQILGAEKALFRALKTKGNTPKYGLIYHSTFIGRAGTKHKGRISRFLANKCSIACRIDCFSDVPTTKFGEALRNQVEERLNFFETGAPVSKNADAIQKALTAIAADLGDDHDDDDDEEGEVDAVEVSEVSWLSLAAVISWPLGMSSSAFQRATSMPSRPAPC
jgi:nucleolar protein 56